MVKKIIIFISPSLFFGLLLSSLFFTETSPLFAVTTAKLHISYGLTFFYKKQYVRAFEEFRKALTLEPNNPLVHYNLGRVYKIKGQYGDAQKHFEVALRLDPDLVAVKRELIELQSLSRKKIEKKLGVNSENQFDNAVSAFSDSRNFLELGRAAFQNGDEPTAIGHFIRALAEDPNNSEIAGTLGFLYKKAGDLSKSREYYQKSVSLGSQNGETYYNLAQIYKDLRQFESAQNILEKGVQLDPLQLKFHLLLADLYEQTENFGEAFSSYEKILKLDPQNSLVKARWDGLKVRLGEYYFSRGDYYFSNSQWDKALENFQKAETNGNWSGVRRKNLKEKIYVSQYWLGKAEKVRVEQAKTSSQNEGSYVTNDFSIDDAVQNPDKYTGRFVRWTGWLQFIDRDNNRLYFTEQKRAEPGLTNYFIVEYKGVLPVSDRRVARYAFLNIIGKLAPARFLIDPNTNQTSTRKQPVVQATELVFFHPDVSGELRLKFF